MLASHKAVVSAGALWVQLLASLVAPGPCSRHQHTQALHAVVLQATCRPPDQLAWHPGNHVCCLMCANPAHTAALRRTCWGWVRHPQRLLHPNSTTSGHNSSVRSSSSRSQHSSICWTRRWHPSQRSSQHSSSTQRSSSGQHSHGMGPPRSSTRSSTTSGRAAYQRCCRCAWAARLAGIQHTRTVRVSVC